MKPFGFWVLVVEFSCFGHPIPKRERTISVAKTSEWHAPITDSVKNLQNFQTLNLHSLLKWYQSWHKRQLSKESWKDAAKAHNTAWWHSTPHLKIGIVSGICNRVPSAKETRSWNGERKGACCFTGFILLKSTVIQQTRNRRHTDDSWCTIIADLNETNVSGSISISKRTTTYRTHTTSTKRLWKPQRHFQWLHMEVASTDNHNCNRNKKKRQVSVLSCPQWHLVTPPPKWPWFNEEENKPVLP